MSTFLIFSVIAATLVLLLGRRDSARDPRLTLTLLVLLAAYPLLWAWMPKFAIIPSPVTAGHKESTSWAQLLIGLWLAGTSLATLRLILSQWVLHQWKRQSTLIQRINGVEIRILERATSPLATGILRKIIYVPNSWKHQAHEVREMILAHELTHHRRLDPLWKLCAELACAINWFNPLVHWMAHRLALQCELACDADVLRQGTDQTRYAQLLCDFASTQRKPVLAIAMASQSTLEQRVRKIMNPGHRTNALVMIVCALVGVGSAGALSMVTSQQVPAPSPVSQEAQTRLSADPFPGNH